MSIWKALVTFLVTVGIAFIIAFLSTGSINPLQVFVQEGGWIAKIFVGLMLAFALVNSVQIVILIMSRNRLLFVFLTVGIALAISFFSTGSINPLQVYLQESSWPTKILVGLTLAFAIVSVVQMTLMTMTRGFIRAHAGKPAEDVRCACHGEPLLATVKNYGSPKPCPNCDRWWHMNFYRSDLSVARRLIAHCDICEKESSGKTPDLSGLDL